MRRLTAAMAVLAALCAALPATAGALRNGTYRGETTKGGKVELKVAYIRDLGASVVTKFALKARARCSDGKVREMLQGFREQTRLSGEIRNGKFEMKREQSGASPLAVAVTGRISSRRASGTASWTYTFAEYRFVNGVPKPRGDPITCRTGRHRWSAERSGRR